MPNHTCPSWAVVEISKKNWNLHCRVHDDIKECHHLFSVLLGIGRVAERKHNWRPSCTICL